MLLWVAEMPGEARRVNSSSQATYACRVTTGCPWRVRVSDADPDASKQRLEHESEHRAWLIADERGPSPAWTLSDTGYDPFVDGRRHARILELPERE